MSSHAWRPMRWMSVLLWLTIGWPALFYVVRACLTGWEVLSETSRLTVTFVHTVAFAFGTVSVVLPVALLLSHLLFRSDLPGRHLGVWLVVLAAVIPAPVRLVAWRAFLGSLHWWPLATGPVGIFPSASNLALAIFLESALVMPWAVLVLGSASRWAPTRLEEDASTMWPGFGVWCRATWPAVRPTSALAAGVVLVHAWSDIVVADHLRILTFAEEVYLQTIAGGEDRQARSVVATLPGSALLALIFVFLCPLSDVRTATLDPTQPTYVYRLRRWRSAALCFVWATMTVLIAVPMAGLIARAGMEYGAVTSPQPHWSWQALASRLVHACAEHWTLLGRSAVVAGGTGAALAVFSTLAAWLGRGHGLLASAQWAVAASAWVLPAPIIGLAIAEGIQVLLRLPGGWLTAWALYDHPSPLPSMWALTLRYFWVGLAIATALVRQIPRNLEEQALVDGGGVWGSLYLLVPLLYRVAAIVCLTTSLLCLGEMAASWPAATPGFETLAEHVFKQLHFGAEPELAALCLVLTLLTGLFGLPIVGWAGQGWQISSLLKTAKRL